MMRVAMMITSALVLAANPAWGQVSAVKIPAAREAILAPPHKKNNDGAWAYGWVRTTARQLIGFDLTPLEGRAEDVVSAEIRVFVAQNHFNAAGRHYDAHPFDPEAGFGEWLEGHNRFNSFSYCQQSSWSVPADEYAGPDNEADGCTWNCPIDPDYLSPAIECTANESWAPSPQSAVHLGFDDDISDRTAIGENTTFETDDDCAVPVTDAETCDPSCSSSLDCFGAGANGKSVDECWRAFVIDVTTDVQNALAASPANLLPSWMIKRRVESGAGSFHFFSREGAICVLGASDPDYEALQPALVVSLVGSAPTITPPADHCEAY